MTPSPGQVSVPNSFDSLFVFYKVAGCLPAPPLPEEEPEPEGKGLLQSQLQRWRLPPNCEQAPSC